MADYSKTFLLLALRMIKLPAGVVGNHLTKITFVIHPKFICSLKCNRSKNQFFVKNLIFFLISGTLMMSTQAAPVNGEVVAGQGSIRQSGNTTTINQQSQTLSLNWNSFNIAQNERVNFNQPGRNALAVNRVLGSGQASHIQGHLNANGQVWLINPNGVIFGKDSIVNVGGLLASTLDIADTQLNQSQRKFSGNSRGKIINYANIRTPPGGYVAMLANTVSNQCQIQTPQGSSVLGGGSEITVTFAENQLTGIRIDKSTVNNLVENKQIIIANGGKVIMTAGAHDSLLSSVVNNSGIVEAQTIKNQQGNIILLAGMESGIVTINGSLDASAPTGGQGGKIETSAAHVHIDPKVKISTVSAQGRNGTWTIDPQDYTIAASDADITGAQVSELLKKNNIIIASDQGHIAGSGDLNVKDAITWSNSNSLTLQASRDVKFNSDSKITNDGAGTLNVKADANATGQGTIVMQGGSINVSGKGGGINFYYNPATFGTPTAFDNVNANNQSVFTPYMLINTADNLQAISQNTNQNYALAKDIDLSSFGNFTPIQSFNGKFDGQNLEIKHLQIKANENANLGNEVGLFAILQKESQVKNLTLSDVNVSGPGGVGALAGVGRGSVNNIKVSGVVSGSGLGSLGGVFGVAGESSSGEDIISSVNISIDNIKNDNLKNNAYNAYIGGFAGKVFAGPAVKYSNVAISGYVKLNNLNTKLTQVYIGGFVGKNEAATIKNSYSSGNLDLNALATNTLTKLFVGGFAAENHGTIENSYASGNLDLNLLATNTLKRLFVGGFVAENHGTIETSYSKVNVTTKINYKLSKSLNLPSFGGFVGINREGGLTNVYSRGSINISVSDGNKLTMIVGGLIGWHGKLNRYPNENSNSVLKNGYSKSLVTVKNIDMSNVGGLIGHLNSKSATVAGGFWDKNTSNQDKSRAGISMSTDDMLNQANFTSGTKANQQENPNWDFENVWEMGSGDYRYPVFKVTKTPVGPTPEMIESFYPLILKNLHAKDKVYDATTIENSIDYDLWGKLNQYNVGVNVSGNFDNKNVGQDKTVTLIQPTLSGSQVKKYVLVSSPLLKGLKANITKRAIKVTAKANDKEYDGTTKATLAKIDLAKGANGVIENDDVRFDEGALSAAQANFADKNAGLNKDVNVDAIPTIGGTDGKNYVVSDLPKGLKANITKRAIKVTAKANDKEYDGTTKATLAKIDLAKGANGVIENDDVRFDEGALSAAQANFTDKNAGLNKDVNVDAIPTIGGTDGKNYVVSDLPKGLTANITPHNITIIAKGEDKIYDGNASASVELNSADIVSGDSLIFNYESADFSTAGPGIKIPIQVKGITANGTDQVNYKILDQETETSANIFGIISISPNNPALPQSFYLYSNQSITTTLRKPLTGCLYNAYDKPATDCLFKLFTTPNIRVMGTGVGLPKHIHMQKIKYVFDKATFPKPHHTQ